MAKEWNDKIDVALTLMLIAIMLAFASQLILIFLVSFRRKERRRSYLHYTLIVVCVYALAQWTSFFIAVYIDKDPLQTIPGQISIFAMSMFLASIYTFITLSTFVDNDDIPRHSTELYTKTFHLCFSALLAVISISIFLWLILGSIGDEPFQIILWIVNLMTLYGIGKLCLVSSCRLYGMSVLKRLSMDMNDVEGYTIEDTQRCTVLNLSVFAVSFLLYITNFILLLAAKSDLVYGIVHTDLTNTASATVNCIVCIDNAVVTVMATLCCWLMVEVDPKMYFLCCGVSDSLFHRVLYMLIENKVQRTVVTSNDMSAMFKQWEMEMEKDEDGAIELEMTALDGIAGAPRDSTRSPTSKYTGTVPIGSNSGLSAVSRTAVTAMTGTTSSIEDEGTDPNFKQFSMSLDGVGDTMHCTFDIDHEDGHHVVERLQYQRIHQFEAPIAVQQYLDHFVDNDGAFGMERYITSPINSDIVVTPWRAEKEDQHHEHGDLQWFQRTCTWKRSVSLPEWFIAVFGDFASIWSHLECHKCYIGRDFAVHWSVWKMTNGPFEGEFRVFVKQLIRQRVEQEEFHLNIDEVMKMETFTNIETFYAIQWISNTIFKGQIENRVVTGVQEDCAAFEQYVVEHSQALQIQREISQMSK